jgi:hypothetical protein
MVDQSNPSPLENIPVGLKPIYSTTNPNNNINLYNGRLEITQGGSTFTGEGVVQLEWLPRPRFWFHFHHGGDAQERFDLLSAPDLSGAVLRLVDTSQDADAVVTRTRFFAVGGETDERPAISGIINNYIYSSNNIAGLIFHVANFRDYHGSMIRSESSTSVWDGRAVFQAGDWRITLDKNQGGSPFFEELKATGGYAITHVGKLERIDGGAFSADDVDTVREALYRYLSFCSGIWSAPILLVGFDASGNRVFEEWRAPKVERWRNVASWFNDFSVDGLVAGFPGFLERWRDETWNEPLLLALHWYGEANMSAGGVEGSLILAQAAFEVLAWTLLVEDKQVLSEDGFQKLPAMDKLRLLISDCGIPLGIPSSLSLLAAIAKAENWKDGPQALTELRNALVHSNPKKRKKVLGADIRVRHEASDLSLWYLELILLKIFDYNGDYASRLVRGGYRGNEIESLPWK